jgi:SAM-dependent methyltransferase
MTTQQLDPAKAEAFAGQVIGIYNGASLALMISVGNRTGLFDKMSELPPSTSEQIATAAGLDERYVREWLGAMTAGRFVEHDAKKMTYTLPPEHAASLTHAAGTGNLANMAEFFALMGDVEDQIVDSFRKGGGVPYSGFPKFQELMRQESAAVFDQTLVQATLPMVDGLIDRLNAGIDVADVGCGAGHAVNVMARAFPKSRFTGYDFSEEGVARGRAEAAEWGLKNARFEVKDAATLDGSTKFDFITTFDAIHDQAKPARVLAGISEALKPGGVYLCVDIQADSTHAGNLAHPLAPFLYMVSTFHCMTVSLAYGGDGLGTAWGEQLATKMLNDAGFKDITVKRVEGDIINNYYIARK